MKKKANIYDADDVERSKRLNFTPEERAARAEHKAEVLGTKLEKAKKKVPKKKKLRLQKELDPEKSKLKHTLRFEEVEKKRGQEALPKKAGRRMVQSASATVHSKIHQVEEENVGTKAAHRTELASEGAAALASHEIRKYRQNAPYKRVEKLEAQVNRANVSAAYRAAVRDNPELQENTVKRLIQKQRIKHQYAKEFRKAKQAEKQGSAFVQKAKDMFAPIGLGFWQIAVALIAGISAKEVVVSSCAVLFGVPNINSGAGMDTLVGILSASGFGQLNAFCLMVFCLLYIPCAAALATIRKESGSTRWMLLSALFQLVVAWVVTFIVYRIGLFI